MEIDRVPTQCQLKAPSDGGGDTEGPSAPDNELGSQGGDEALEFSNVEIFGDVGRPYPGCGAGHFATSFTIEEFWPGTAVLMEV